MPNGRGYYLFILAVRFWASRQSSCDSLLPSFHVDVNDDDAEEYLARKWVHGSQGEAYKNRWLSPIIRRTFSSATSFVNYNARNAPDPNDFSLSCGECHATTFKGRCRNLKSTDTLPVHCVESSLCFTLTVTIKMFGLATVENSTNLSPTMVLSLGSVVLGGVLESASADIARLRAANNQSSFHSGAMFLRNLQSRRQFLSEASRSVVKKKEKDARDMLRLLPLTLNIAKWSDVLPTYLSHVSPRNGPIFSMLTNLSKYAIT